MLKLICQIISVSTLMLATHLAIKKNRWCWVFYQIGAIARAISYVKVGLHIELLVQFFFTYMNVKGFIKWRKSK